MRWIIPCVLLAVACSASSESSVSPKAPAQARPAATRQSRAPSGVLWREDVVATIRAGLGRFLGRVDVERSMRAGRFLGWRILSLQPESYWRGIDLRPGDIVTTVNGMPLERPTQAHAAFVSLEKAQGLRVGLVRDNQHLQLRLRIVERDGASHRPPGPATRAKRSRDYR